MIQDILKQFSISEPKLTFGRRRFRTSIDGFFLKFEGAPSREVLNSSDVLNLCVQHDINLAELLKKEHDYYSSQFGLGLSVIFADENVKKYDSIHQDIVFAVSVVEFLNNVKSTNRQISLHDSSGITSLYYGSSSHYQYIFSQHVVQSLNASYKDINAQIDELGLITINKITNDVLERQLSEVAELVKPYHKSFQKLTNTLKDYLLAITDHEVHNVLNGMRETLELLLREIFRNSKSLEHNLPLVGGLLKDSGFHKYISSQQHILTNLLTEMTSKIEEDLKGYKDYMNSVKHDSYSNPKELEFMFHQTINFMWLLLKIIQSE